MHDRPFTVPTFDFERAGGAYRRLSAQASIPAARLALMVFVLVLTIPVVLLVLLAALVAAATFTILALAQRLRNCIRGLFAGSGGVMVPRNDGRENVRVIERID